MSDNYMQPDEDDDEDRQPTPAELREAAKRGAKAKAEAEALRRENAFLRAGIDPEDQRLKYFVKGYEGDLTTEQIRSAAVEAGFIQIQQQAPDPEIDQAREGQSRVMNATGGTVPQFDLSSVEYAMEQGLSQGGLEGLSAVAQQYGVTFQPEEV